MIIHSDWHIHSEASYDGSLALKDIARAGLREYGFCKIGITDHLNFNDTKFLSDLKNSAESVMEYQKNCADMILGVELTPIAKPEFDFIAKSGTREGYIAPISAEPYELELAATKQELIKFGVKYAVGAAHWRLDVPKEQADPKDIKACINEWYRQQLWLANDERVTILGHPWYHPYGLWYDDFTKVPQGMKSDISAALKENKKYVECNADFFRSPDSTEKFKLQYAEFLRGLFEMGIPVTYGSDSHGGYCPDHLEAEKYLILAGFKDGDFSELTEKDFWK